MDMGKYKIGDRIGAIKCMDENTVYLFGFGTYLGDEFPPDDPSGNRGLMALVHKAGIENPKLKMDDGTIVWGCECWWGDETTVKKNIEGKKIVIIKPGV